MIETVPFEVGHLDLLKWRDFDRQITLKVDNFPQIAQAMARATLVGITALHRGRPVACAGVMPVNAGVGYSWMFGSIYLRGCSRPFIREARVWLANQMRDMDWHRLQTVCHADDKQGQAWVQLLGFAPEATMRQYGGDRSDYVMFARVKEK